MPMTSMSSALEIALRRVANFSNWWYEVNNSAWWQDLIFQIIAVLYGIIGFFALIQLVRIDCIVPEYGWTTQKVFHFLNFVVSGTRSIVFFRRRYIEHISEFFQHVLLDFPGLLFLTTYALLALFWTEIYYQAHGRAIDLLRATFWLINTLIYITQLEIWVALWWKSASSTIVLSKIFFPGVLVFSAFGFLFYGGRLFIFLHRFPLESLGRQRKLWEVGSITTICFFCFSIRSVMMFFNAYNKATKLDVLNHPILNLFYYLLVEILPSALVLFILRKLLPERRIIQYHDYHSIQQASAPRRLEWTSINPMQRNSSEASGSTRSSLPRSTRISHSLTSAEASSTLREPGISNRSASSTSVAETSSATRTTFPGSSISTPTTSTAVSNTVRGVSQPGRSNRSTHSTSAAGVSSGTRTLFPGSNVPVPSTFTEISSIERVQQSGRINRSAPSTYVVEASGATRPSHPVSTVLSTSTEVSDRRVPQPGRSTRSIPSTSVQETSGTTRALLPRSNVSISISIEEASGSTRASLARSSASVPSTSTRTPGRVGVSQPTSSRSIPSTSVQETSGTTGALLPRSNVSISTSIEEASGSTRASLARSSASNPSTSTRTPGRVRVSQPISSRSIPVASASDRQDIVGVGPVKSENSDDDSLLQKLIDILD